MIIYNCMCACYDRRLRISMTHLVQYVTRSTYSSFLRCSVPPAWNKLKAYVTHAQTVYSFKKQLLKGLL